MFFLSQYDIILVMKQIAYMTVKQAAERWGVQARQVQYLCSQGRVKGAVRFNGVWAIPGNAAKPHSSKLKAVAKPSLKPEMDLLIFKEICDHFPYSINVTEPGGTMIYANEAFFEGTISEARVNAIGEYNILTEKMVEKWGLKEHLQKVFGGERAFTRNLKFPNKELVGERYKKEYAFVSIYNDIASFPLFDEENRLRYVISVFVPVRRYEAREEVAQAREYIEEYWLEAFDMERIAKNVNSSPATLWQLFKKETGFTLHDYYTDIKIKHLKEKLLDANLSIQQAFHVCGMDYSSYYTSLFKRHTGLTPRQFRNSHK